jgi:aquaporin Z
LSITNIVLFLLGFRSSFLITTFHLSPNKKKKKKKKKKIKFFFHRLVLQKDSESESEEYETYEYETETGEEGEGEEESGEEESEEEEESSEEESSEKDKKKKDDKKDAKKKEESEESSEYESEYESESSEKKKDGKKDDKKEESSEYEYESEYEEEESKEGEESSEYEYETDSQYESSSSSSSSSAKPAAAKAAAAAKDTKTDIAQVTKGTGAAPAAASGNNAAASANAAPAAAKAGAVQHVVAHERALLHDDTDNKALWAPARYFGEFVGTFVLSWAVYMTRATLANPFEVPQSGNSVGGLVGVALVSAFVYAAMLAAFGRTSGGHFNPAVTITYMLIGEVNIAVGIVYIITQFAGAILAAALTWGLLPPLQTAVVPGIRYAAPIACAWWDVNDVTPAGYMHPDHVCTYQAFGAEIAGTLVLLIAVLVAGLGGYGRGETYIALGVALGAAVFATLPISNAHLNPARAIGAAIFAHEFNWFDIWVWIIGPISAIAVAAPLYFWVFKPQAAGAAAKPKPAAAAKPAEKKK